MSKLVYLYLYENNDYVRMNIIKYMWYITYPMILLLTSK